MKWISILLIFLFLSFPCSTGAGEKEIKLMIPAPKAEKAKDSKTGQLKTYWVFPKAEEKRTYNEVKLKEFIDQFKEYFEVKQIELWIEGRTESKGVTTLFISLEAGGGIKVVLGLK
jgi:hypothetical protein